MCIARERARACVARRGSTSITIMLVFIVPPGCPGPSIKPRIVNEYYNILRLGRTLRRCICNNTHTNMFYVCYAADVLLISSFKYTHTHKQLAQTTNCARVQAREMRSAATAAPSAAARKRGGGAGERVKMVVRRTEKHTAAAAAVKCPH